MVTEKTVMARLPKALRVCEQLRKEIRTGTHGVQGSPFPPVRMLAERYDVSLVTAQKVVTMLKEDGLLQLEGKRYLVAEKANEAARSLRLGVVVTMLDNPFFAMLLKNIEIAAGKRNIEVIAVSSNYDSAREKELLTMFVRDGVDGILACPAHDDDSTVNFSGVKLPYVLIGRKINGLNVDTVLVQNFSAGQAVARHLSACGMKHFGYVGLKNYACDLRLQGFRTGLAEAGFELSDDMVVTVDNKDLNQMPSSLADMLHRLPRKCGIFCFHDLLAARLLRLAGRYHLRVPEDLAVVGFDNLPIAAELTPPLTSVAYPLDQMAETALTMICRRIEGDHSRPMVSYLDPMLVIRESTVGGSLSDSGMALRTECLTYNLV